MKTKNIFKALALAMLVPAMLFSTACQKESTVQEEDIVKKGYELPVTVNVTRQGNGGTTRASYNEGTKKLEFSAGDKLFVEGSYHEGDYNFAGTLTWVSDGTFSGTITTQTEWTGTVDELLSQDGGAQATLLPAGYESYDFLTLENEGTYSAYVGSDYNNAFATSKAAGVEQLSYEYCYTYSSGFTLTPCNAILNFTITGLSASTEVAVVFSYSTTTVNKNVTTDGSGNATFAIGLSYGEDLNNCTLTVGGNAITLVNSSKVLEAGHIYNITRSAAPSYPLLSAATSSDYGKVVCAAGHLHTAKTAVPAGCTAVGILGKVTETGHGLILALQDATPQTWDAIFSWAWPTYAGTRLRVLPDDAARGVKLTSYTALGATAVSNWAVAPKSDYEVIFTNLGSTAPYWDGQTYDDNVNAYITGAGGAAFSQSRYWSATWKTDYRSWYFYKDYWSYDPNGDIHSVRPVLGF